MVAPKCLSIQFHHLCEKKTTCDSIVEGETSQTKIDAF